MNGKFGLTKEAVEELIQRAETMKVGTIKGTIIQKNVDGFNEAVFEPDEKSLIDKINNLGQTVNMWINTNIFKRVKHFYLVKSANIRLKRLRSKYYDEVDDLPFEIYLDEKGRYYVTDTDNQKYYLNAELTRVIDNNKIIYSFAQDADGCFALTQDVYAYIDEFEFRYVGEAAKKRDTNPFEGFLGDNAWLIKDAEGYSYNDNDKPVTDFNNEDKPQNTNNIIDIRDYLDPNGARRK